MKESKLGVGVITKAIHPCDSGPTITLVNNLIVMRNRHNSRSERVIPRAYLSILVSGGIEAGVAAGAVT